MGCESVQSLLVLLVVEQAVEPDLNVDELGVGGAGRVEVRPFRNAGFRRAGVDDQKVATSCDAFGHRAVEEGIVGHERPPSCSRGSSLSSGASVGSSARLAHFATSP